MTDYGAIYAKASRENAPGLGRDNFDAGIAAVVATAKVEALDAMADEVYDTDDGTSEPSADFYWRLVLARAFKYRVASLAAAHTTDLREQSKFYAVKSMPDGVGE